MSRRLAFPAAAVAVSLCLAACQGTPLPAAPAKAAKAATATPAAAPAAADRVIAPRRSTPGFAADLAALPDTAAYGAFVHFGSGTPAEHRALMADRGLSVGHDFEDTAQALYVMGPVSAFRTLVDEPMVSYLEDNPVLSLLDETDGWATRARVAQEPVSGGPYFDAAGNVLRGQGVGVGVIDSGLRGDHPDFASNLARNYRVTCPVPTLDEANIPFCQFTDLGRTTSSEVAGGHGTHCAGIAVGDGAASTGLYPVADAAPNVKGTFAGVAPGSRLYSFGAGAGLNILVLNAAASFDKTIRDNASGANNPKVRVLSNSYGGDAPFDANAVLSKLVNRAIDDGISVVFAAGNDGAAEAATAADPSKTGASCRNPKPGLICVASYNDEGTGRRDAALSGFSSRAEASRLSEYPDIAAPGDLITSPCSQGDPGQVVCSTGAETRWAPVYGTISGTSMATPHVAGVIALMYQARPDLTPAEVENVIKDTAIKLTTDGPYVNDPSNPGGTTNPGFGAGLIDVPAILDRLGVAKGTMPLPGARVVADGDAETTLAGAADIVTVTLTEAAEGGQNGIRFALTLRDAAAFGTPAASQVRLMVEMNVDGQRFTAGAVLRPDGSVTAVPRGPAVNAAATSAAKVGNRVEFFVPLGALGGPAVGAPIHNLMATSFSTTPQGEQAVDYTPSASAVAALAAARPTYGKPYTVLSASSPVAENVCEAPGASVLTDTAGDVVLDTGAPSLDSSDISALGIAQPLQADGSYKLVFTLKMAGLNPLPQGMTWPVNFCAPAVPACTGASAYSATNKFFTVRMTTDASLKRSPGGTAPEFQVLIPTATGTTAASRTVQLADAQSRFNADGTISLVVNAGDIGLSAAGAGTPGQTLSQFLVRVTNTSGTTPDNMPNEATQGAGSYATRPVAFCAPNVLPVARLTVDAPSKTRGTAFQFSGATSTDADAADRIVRYEFDFGDQTPPVVSTDASVRHVYERSGNYSASLKVTDSKGGVSAQAATLGIAVINTAPVAALEADRSSGNVPLTVTFDASAARDADANDRVVRYSFDLDGDGVFEITDATEPRASTTYTTDGTRTAAVKVKDTEGLESAVVTRAISVGSAPGAAAPVVPAPAVVADSDGGRFGGGSMGLAALGVLGALLLLGRRRVR